MDSQNKPEQKFLNSTDGLYETVKRHRSFEEDSIITENKRIKKPEIQEKEKNYASHLYLTPFLAKKIKDSQNSIHNAPKKNNKHTPSYMNEDLNDVKRVLNFGSCDKIDEYPIVSDFSSNVFFENSNTETLKKGYNYSSKSGCEFNTRYYANFGEQRK